jgi:hypothetical protein
MIVASSLLSAILNHLPARSAPEGLGLGTYSMAVRAAYVTLLDLSQDPFPVTVHGLADPERLIHWLAVIELQRTGVQVISAVNAAARQLVFINELSALRISLQDIGAPVIGVAGVVPPLVFLDAIPVSCPPCAPVLCSIGH